MSTGQDRWALAVDFGTSRTTGAMASGGTITALEVDSNRWIASMVLLAPDGTVLVGTAAENQAGVHPDRVERTPKRRVGSGAPLLLGGESLEVVDAIAAILRRFADEGRLRRNGRDPDAVVLTHPVRWEQTRCDVLVAAARAAGLPEPILVEEPVAAAIHYVGDQVAVGQYVGVYDLGGGTFDTAILQRTDTGFVSVGAPGGDEHIGGEDFDHQLFRYFGALIAADAPEVWDQLLTSEERKWQRAAADLLVQSRRAKEALSSFPQTQVFVPDADRDFMVTRAQFDDMIRDAVERTVDEMEDTVASAGLKPADLSALYLVGGSSRIPLVVAQLTERFGTRVATRDEPKSVVALGAAILASRELAAQAPEPAVAAALAEPETVAAAVADEAIAWRADLPALATTYVTIDALLAAVDTNLEIVAWSMADGIVQWRAPLGGQPAGPPVGAGDSIYAARDDGYVGAFDATTGLARWWALAPVRPNGAMVAGDDLVVVVGDDGALVAFDAASGAQRWHEPVGMAPGVAPGLMGSTLVVGGTDGRVGGLDPQTGQARWWYPTGGAVTGLAAEADVILAIANGLLFALDPDTGEARFAFRADAAVLGAAVVGDGIAVLAADQVLSMLARSDGLERWRRSLGTTGAIGPVVTGSHVAIAEYELRTFGVDSGAPDATMPVAPGWYPAATDTLVVVTGADGALIAVHPGK